MRQTIFKRYGYLWVTLAFLLFSLAGHWFFSWRSYVDEQLSNNKPVQTSEYVDRVLEGTFENWQSEFLQLIWQVGGLTFFLWVGSPQSREGDEREEEKIDALLELINPQEASKIIKRLNTKYPKH